jgi:hypothetical protein
MIQISMLAVYLELPVASSPTLATNRHARRHAAMIRVKSLRPEPDRKPSGSLATGGR